MDVKPSNLLLAQPFFTRGEAPTHSSGASSGGSGSKSSKGGARSLSRREIVSARWALADFGSAARLAPALRWEWSVSAPWALLPRLRWEAGEEPPYETPAYSPPEVCDL